MKRDISTRILAGLMVVFSEVAFARTSVEALSAVAKRLPSGRGEFESSGDYRTRVERAIKEPFIFQGEPKDVSYDADSEVFTVNPEMKEQSKCENRGTFIARTAMNAKFKVTRTNCETFQLYVKNPEQMLELVQINVPRKNASRWKDDLKVRYGVSISPDPNGNPVSRDVSAFTTSLDVPLEGFSSHFQIFVVVDKLEVVRASSGEVVFSLDRRKQEELARAQDNARKREELNHKEAARKREEEQIKLDQEAMDKSWPVRDRKPFDDKCLTANGHAVDGGRPLCACLEVQLFKKYGSGITKAGTGVKTLKRMRFECVSKSEASQEIPGPTIFAAPSLAKNNWGDAASHGYIRDCIARLTTQYMARRTPEQIRYACECITWTLQDSYSLAQYFGLSSGSYG